MDIRFHYYVIKTLAAKAGFLGEDAQLLAEYSQFVDDYNLDGEMPMGSVPEFARHLAREEGPLWRFACVTTGFRDAGDYAQLALRSRQRDVLLPFHLIPPQSLKTKVESSAAWRTCPERLDQPTLLRGLLRHAQERYKKKPSRPNLIRLGLLAHIFADTYAHQKFCGYGGWWNYGVVAEAEYATVRDDDFDRDSPQQASPAAVQGLALGGAVGGHDPARDGFKSLFIAHSSFGWAPDDPTCRFTAEQQKEEGCEKLHKYERKNIDIFLEGAEVMFDFFRDCLMTPAREADRRFMEEPLRSALLTSKTDVDTLDRRWKHYFPDIDYHYDMEKLFPRLKARNPAVYEATEDFFWFNVAADEVRRAVNSAPSASA